MAKAKWKGYTYEQKGEIQAKIQTVCNKLDVLQGLVANSSINLDMEYYDAFELMEELYGDLDIHNLTLDNQRRWKAHKKMIERNEHE